jgi:hypothetical protein
VALWAVIASIFLSVREIDEEGNRSLSQEKTLVYGQQTIREGLPWLHERPVKDLFSHDATSWMDLVHQLDACTRGPASGCPAVVVVQTTHDRKRDYLVPYIPSRRNRSVLFRYVLPNPLMGSSLVEVSHIRLEHTVELPLMEDQQMIETLLPDAPQEPFAEGIGSWCMDGCFEKLDITGRRPSAETGSKFAVVITDEIFGGLPKRSGFSQLLRHPGIGRRASDADVDHLP